MPVPRHPVRFERDALKDATRSSLASNPIEVPGRDAVDALTGATPRAAGRCVRVV